jgi:hypothetical protein
MYRYALISLVPVTRQLNCRTVPAGHAEASGTRLAPLPANALTKAHLPSALVSFTHPAIVTPPDAQTRFHAASPPVVTGWNDWPQVPSGMTFPPTGVLAAAGVTIPTSAIALAASATAHLDIDNRIMEFPFDSH